jgi:spermidine synthase
MLACFLFGLVCGSHLGRGIDRSKQPVSVLAALQLALSVTVALAGLLLYFVPSLVGDRAALSGPIASLWVRLLIAAVVITPTTILLGATFPVGARACTERPEHAGGAVGSIYAANTAGALLGSLAGGFVLIPCVGCQRGIALIAAAFLVNGAYLAVRVGYRLRALRIPLALGAVACAATGLLPPRVVLPLGMGSPAQYSVLYHGEGTAHTVDILRARNGDIIMDLDGQFMSSLGVRNRMMIKGHLPLILHPAPKRAAVIGLGLGLTLLATTRHPELAAIELVELSPETVKAQDYLGEVTHGALQDPRVQLRIDDARNFFAMSDERFDVIAADPAHPQMTGVGYLYSAEYYRAVERHLNPGGIICQWLPLQRISPTSLAAAIRTFTAVFPSGSLWSGDAASALLIGVRGDFQLDVEAIARHLRAPSVIADLGSVASPEQLLGMLLLGPEQLARYLADAGGAQTVTDDSVYLEYHAPLGAGGPSLKDQLVKYAR